jgi:hypothetical protein
MTCTYRSSAEGAALLQRFLGPIYPSSRPVIEYIRNQDEHHKRLGFEDELLDLLRRHGIEYDPRYVFD